MDAQQIINGRPDFVLFCKARTGRSGHLIIEDLKKAGIKTVSWLFDLYWDLPPDRGITRSPLDPPFDCDYVFTTDGGHEKEWKDHGVSHYLLRQGCHLPEAVLGQKVLGVPPIVFTGSIVFRQRMRLLRHMHDKYKKDFAHYGSGGNMPETRQLKLNDVFASAKIVLGDSQPSPKYWSNRIYEVLGRGGFLIHPLVEGIDKEFGPYKHFIPYTFGNFDELDEIINYYLTHDEEREKIRLAGHEYCKENYTYTKRVAEMLKTIK